VARWRGVPLAHVLRRAGLERWRAVDVLPEGLDATVVANGVDNGHVRRPLPIEKPFNDLGYLFGAVVRHPVVAT
jgi:DMSO/TMAO reductase YedYZ molybdopterin-dependent catalytic subunit